MNADTDKGYVIDVCSAIRCIKPLYCLPDADGKTPVFDVYADWGTAESIAFFTSKAMIPEELLSEYTVHRTSIQQVVKKLEKRSRNFRYVDFNLGDNQLVINKEDFRNRLRDVSRADDAIAYALANGVDGDCLFPAIAAFFIGHSVICRFSDGSEAAGKAVSLIIKGDRNSIVIEAGSGKETRIPFSKISHISLGPQDQGTDEKPQGRGRKQQ